MSREVPEGWTSTTLGEQIADMRGGGTPSRKVPEYWDGSIPWASVKDLKGRYIDDTEESISEDGLQNCASSLIPKGTLILATRMAVGKAVRFSQDVAINQDLRAIFPRPSLDVDFLHQWFSWQESHIARLGSGTTVAGIRQETIRGLLLALPPLQEQRRIAEILFSVDEAIAATRAVIEQTRKVKQGVLERLLTKGIGHTRFKQTAIGEIPEGWEVATLEELLADIPNPMRSGPFGSALKSQELVEAGVPFLGIDNIQVESFVRNYKRFLSEDKFRQLRRFAVNPNDVVITIMGTVGRCCVIPPDIGEAVSSKHIWAMSLHHEKYIPELACWQMNFAPWIVSRFTTSAQGGIMSAINSGVLRKLVFPVPGLEEQRQILQVWQSCQSELEVEQVKLHNLESLKSALMSDLLAGRKRVIDALPMAAE